MKLQTSRWSKHLHQYIKVKLGNNNNKNRNLSC